MSVEPTNNPVVYHFETLLILKELDEFLPQ